MGGHSLALTFFHPHPSHNSMPGTPGGGCQRSRAAGGGTQGPNCRSGESAKVHSNLPPTFRTCGRDHRTGVLRHLFRLDPFLSMRWWHVRRCGAGPNCPRAHGRDTHMKTCPGKARGAKQLRVYCAVHIFTLQNTLCTTTRMRHHINQLVSTNLQS